MHDLTDYYKGNNACRSNMKAEPIIHSSLSPECINPNENHCDELCCVLRIRIPQPLPNVAVRVRQRKRGKLRTTFQDAPIAGATQAVADRIATSRSEETELGFERVEAAVVV